MVYYFVSVVSEVFLEAFDEILMNFKKNLKR